MSLSPSILAGIFGLGGTELMIILFIILLLFGGAKLPALAKGLGQSVKEFKKAAEDAKDPEVRAFAAKTLPILQDHLKLAEDVEASLKRTMSKNGRVKEYQYQPVAEK